MKCKEIHVHLTTDSLDKETHLTYLSTRECVNLPGIWPIVHTTQTHFLTFMYAERLFVHCYGRMHEITMGDCEGTKREISEAHNIEKMLIAGEFSWF